MESVRQSLRIVGVRSRSDNKMKQLRLAADAYEPTQGAKIDQQPQACDLRTSPPLPPHRPINQPCSLSHFALKHIPEVHKHIPRHSLRDRGQIEPTVRVPLRQQHQRIGPRPRPRPNLLHSSQVSSMPRRPLRFPPQRVSRLLELAYTQMTATLSHPNQKPTYRSQVSLVPPQAFFKAPSDRYHLPD